jgi:RNA polymerase sigma factor (sigma-70 family)
MGNGDFDLGSCLEQVRQQSQDAARALVEQLYPQVIRIVRAHLPRRMAEEDLAQEIFVKLFRRLDQYRPRACVPFEHWVSRLAVRTCLDALRAERRRPELRWSDLSEEQAAGLERMLTDGTAGPDLAPSVAREAIHSLLAQLPPRDRLVLTWLDLEQQSVNEIAQRMGWSATRVKVCAFRARRKLRAIAQSLEATVSHE